MTAPSLAPPHDIDLEANVLGLMLQYHDVAGLVLTRLHGNVDVFYHQAHRVIFRAFVALHAVAEIADISTVPLWLDKHKLLGRAGGRSYIAAIHNRPDGNVLNITTYCLKLIELYIMRSIADEARTLLRQALDPGMDPHDLLAQTQLMVNNLLAHCQIRGPQSVGALYDDTVDEIVKAASTPDGITGVASGLKALDRVTGGFQPSDLIIIGGRPAMGKTSFTLAMARMAASNPDPCFFVSLEMSRTQLVKKLIATETGRSTSQLVRGMGMSPEEAEGIRSEARALRTLPLIIDDSPGMNISEFRAKLTKAIQEHGIKWAVVDYLQLMTGKQGGNREQEVSSLSRGLKLVAKELNIPIVILCQLSRGPETRDIKEKRPLLSDLRESGAIEQDADLVIFPFRPEYYNIKKDLDGNSLEGMTELIIAKHRNGPLDTVLVQSDMKTGRYQDCETGHLAMLEPEYGW